MNLDLAGGPAARLLMEGVAAGEFRDLDGAMIHHSIVGILAYVPAWFRIRPGRPSASLVTELADFVTAGVSPVRPRVSAQRWSLSGRRASRRRGPPWAGPRVPLVLQHVGPRLAVALLVQEVLRAHDVAGVEVVRIGPRPHRHVLILRAQRRDHRRGALVLHVRQQALDQVADQVHAQGPAVPEVAERVGHVRHAADHDAAPGQPFGEVDRGAVDGERDVAEDREVEAGGGDHDVGRDLLTGADLDAVLGERLDRVSDDGGLALAQRREQVAVRDDGDALLPRPVARGEVLVDVEALGQQRARWPPSGTRVSRRVRPVTSGPASGTARCTGGA